MHNPCFKQLQFCFGVLLFEESRIKQGCAQFISSHFQPSSKTTPGKLTVGDRFFVCCCFQSLEDEILVGLGGRGGNEPAVVQMSDMRPQGGPDGYGAGAGNVSSGSLQFEPHSNLDASMSPEGRRDFGVDL